MNIDDKIRDEKLPQMLTWVGGILAPTLLICP